MLLIIRLGDLPEGAPRTIVEPTLEEAARFTGLSVEEIGQRIFLSGKGPLHRIFGGPNTFMAPTGEFVAVYTHGADVVQYISLADTPHPDDVLERLRNAFLGVLIDQAKPVAPPPKAETPVFALAAAVHRLAELEERADNAMLNDVSVYYGEDSAADWRVFVGLPSDTASIWREALHRATGREIHAARVEITD